MKIIIKEGINNMNKNLVIIYADDWEGVFVDDKLVFEEHQILLGDMKKICVEHNTSIKELKEGYVTEEYYKDALCMTGGFPENLSEVEFEERE